MDEQIITIECEGKRNYLSSLEPFCKRKRRVSKAKSFGSKSSLTMWGTCCLVPPYALDCFKLVLQPYYISHFNHKTCIIYIFIILGEISFITRHRKIAKLWHHWKFSEAWLNKAAGLIPRPPLDLGNTHFLPSNRRMISRGTPNTFTKLNLVIVLWEVL